MKKELGMNENLIGMTGLCLCDKKVTIMKYPTKSKEQTTIDIMVKIKYIFCYHLLLLVLIILPIKKINFFSSS